MWEVFALIGLTTFLPAIALVYLQRRLWDSARAAFPVLLASQFALVAISAASLMALPFGVTKLIVATALATAVNFLISQRLIKSREPLVTPVMSRKVLIALIAVAGLYFMENALVLSAQGWEDGSGRATRFRAPFQSDGQRLVVLVNALERGGTEAPFLYCTTLKYQVFWHHFVALHVVPFQTLTRYPQVLGAVLATSLIFIVVFLASLYAFAPSVLSDFYRAFLLPLLILAHADLYHLANSLLHFGRPAIEADWSMGPIFFRNFSLRLVVLTAPQHAAFFLLVAALLLVRKTRAEARALELTLVEMVFSIFAVVASPILAVFFFPLFFLAELLRIKGTGNSVLPVVKQGVICFAAAFVVHLVLFGFSFHELFIRPDTPPIQFGPSNGRYWRELPLTWVAATGVLGAAATGLALSSSSLLRLSTWARWETLLFVVGGLFFHFVVSGIEVRRHFAMVMAFCGAYFVAQLLKERRSLFQSVMMGLVAVTGILGHGYFLFSYLSLPSYVDPRIPWKDYLGMNQVIRSQFPGVAVAGAGATDLAGTIGLEFPPAMEATTSLGNVYQVAINTKHEESQREMLWWVAETQEVAPYISSLGYSLVTWGPVEERLWGERARHRFVDEKACLASVGSVRLCPWRDSLLDRIEKLPEGLAEREAIQAKIAFSDRWWGEAIFRYQRAIEQSSAEDVLKLRARLAEVFFSRALVYRGEGKMKEAEADLHSALSTDPSFQPAYEPLFLLLLWARRPDQATKILEAATQRWGTVPSLLLLKAQLHAYRWQVEEAVRLLEHLRISSLPPALRARTYLWLSGCYQAMGKTEAAKRYQRMLRAQGHRPDPVEYALIHSWLAARVEE